MLHARPLALLTVFLAFGQAQVPTPTEVLGFAPGTDGRLADQDEILTYHRKLADASDRVLYRVIGRSTEGRDMASVIISDPANLARLEEIREANARLADPRGLTEEEARRLVEGGRVVVLVNESIHSSEVGPAQAGMVTAHFLATTEDPVWEEVLRNTVVVLTPCHNPDGYATTVAWWRRWKDDPKRRGASLPVLYHRYVGHDNNRDWFMMTQQETRVTITELYMTWHPQIVVDQHQMGGTGSRMFVPPYTEPWEPFVHPLLRSQLEDLGRSVIAGMTEEGLRGVWCNRQFDAWTPARAFMHYHGGVRVLTEVASARGPDPLNQAAVMGAARQESEDNPAPWRGGRWGLDDIVRYCSRGALHAIKHGSDHRRRWLENFLRIHQDACAGKAGPDAWVIPDPGRPLMLDKLCDLLTLGGVEIERTTERAVVQGREARAGSLVIRNGQPFFGFACALLTNSPYPVIRTRPDGPIQRPYDMTCHALPLLMGFEAWAVPAADAPSRGTPVPAATLTRHPPPAREMPHTFLLDPRDEGAYLDVFALLREGVPVERIATPISGLPSGAFLVRGLAGTRCRYAKPLTFDGAASGRPVASPRIGVFWSWTASMDEGWTRFFFDDLGIPFIPVRPADVLAGNLSQRIDVLVIADVSARNLTRGPQDGKLPDAYRGGLGTQGLDHLRAFVKGGGTVVTLNGSSDLVIEAFELPLQRMSTRRGRRSNDNEDGSATRTYIPGSVVRSLVDTAHPLGYGSPTTTPVFLREARPLEVRASDEDVRVSLPVRYATEDLVAGGFAEGAEVLHGKAAAAVVEVGEGTLVLFAFSPQFRCQTWSTFRLFLNSLFL